MKKAYITADIEGMEGVLTKFSTVPGNRDYERARKRLANDVNAAARALFDSGYDDVTVCDAHGDMENLIPEDMDTRVMLISGAMRDSLQMQCIERGYDCFVSFGHAGSGLNIDGVLNHCCHGGKIYNMRFNGVTMNTETVINAAIAGYYGVPLIAVVGDAAVVREVKEFMPDAEGIVVKEGFSRYSAMSVHPKVAEDLIYNGVKKAAGHRDKIKPLDIINGETVFEIDFKDTNMADTACLIPCVERIAPRSIRYTGPAEAVFKLHELMVFRLVDTI